MKRKKETKKLKKLIDSKEGENVLNEDAAPYAIKNRASQSEEDDLTEEQMKELDEAIAEADRGETVTFEEFKEAMDRWRTKLKSTRGLE